MNSAERYEEDTQVDDPSRRTALRAIGAVGIMLACGHAEETKSGELPSRYSEEEGGWFRTIEEMKDTYAREYSGEKILKNCFYNRGTEIVGSISGNEFIVPQPFVDRILAHLKQMHEYRSLQYIFRLDAFHGHPFMETQLLKSRYPFKKNDELEDIKILLTDEDVRILYHNSEHMDFTKNDQLVQEIYSKRNAIGGKLDQPLILLPIPRETKRTAVSTPDSATDLQASLKFAAHMDGAFAIQCDDQEIRLDLSLDDNTYY